MNPCWSLSSGEYQASRPACPRGRLRIPGGCTSPLPFPRPRIMAFSLAPKKLPIPALAAGLVLGCQHCSCVGPLSLVCCSGLQDVSEILRQVGALRGADSDARPEWRLSRQSPDWAQLQGVFIPLPPSLRAPLCQLAVRPRKSTHWPVCAVSLCSHFLSGAQPSTMGPPRIVGGRQGVGAVHMWT